MGTAVDRHGDAEMGGNADVEHPKGQADHTRRPIVKDTRRAARTAEPRARTISSKKKNRGKRNNEQQADDSEPVVESSDVAKPVSSKPEAEQAAPAAPSEKGKVKKKNLKKKHGKKQGAEAMDED